MKKAIIIGATGAVGNDLLNQLLINPDYGCIDVFVRRPLEITNDKLHVHVIDFEQPDEWANQLTGDVLFSCLGTTLRQAGSKKAQWRVDYDYQLKFAQVAANNRVGEYLLVSSIGADAHSLNFYLRMKGALEEAVKKLPFRHITILQPPSLIRPHFNRWAEKFSVGVLKSLNRLGLLRSIAPMKTSIVAECMIRYAANGKSGVEVVTNQDIRM